VNTRLAAPTLAVVVALTTAWSDQGESTERRGGGAGSITTRTIEISDPAIGTLRFDALVAGSPEAAADGRLVLLLHGFPETNDTFRAVLPKLAGAGYYAVAPNQRGYSTGARPPDEAAYGIAHLVNDVLGMATALGADRFHLVGHDWGGGVAYAAPVFAPDRLLTVTSLSTPHPDALTDAFDNPDGKQARMSGYMLTFRRPGYEQTVIDQGVARLVRRFSHPALPEVDIDRYVAVLDDRAALKAGLDWYRANPLPVPTRIGPTPVPLLFIYGAGEPFFARSAALATERYAGDRYRFEVIDDVGHSVPQLAPNRVAELVTDHIRTGR
jgi:pimeloyl-ACP methyl ester carboxylesterase